MVWGATALPLEMHGVYLMVSALENDSTRREKWKVLRDTPELSRRDRRNLHGPCPWQLLAGCRRAGRKS